MAAVRRMSHIPEEAGKRLHTKQNTPVEIRAIPESVLAISSSRESRQMP